MIRLLADFFRGFHVAVGITPLPKEASYEEERSFVLTRMAIILGIILWCVVLLNLI